LAGERAEARAAAGQARPGRRVPQLSDPGGLTSMPAAVVLGARHLGGVIIERLVSDGWSTAGVARSDDTLQAIADRGATPLRANPLDPDELAKPSAHAREELGDIDLIVNAISVAGPRPGDPHGGGPIADATLDQYRHWGAQISELAFVFL